MKKFMFFIIVGIIIGSSVLCTAREKIVLSTLDWEPYIGQKLDENGYVAEIVKEAFNRSGYDLELKYYPWARAVNLSKRGKVDGYFPEYYSDELKKDSLVSEKFPGGPVGFFKKKGSDIEFKSLESLKPYKIGVVRGYVNEAKFDAANYLHKEVVTTDVLNIKKLLKGRIDLFVGDKFVGYYTQRTNDLEKLGEMEFISPPLTVQDLYVCISQKSKDSKKKIKAFNDGLKSMKEDGTIDKILKKHGF